MYDTLRPELITATEAQRQRMQFDPTTVVDIRLFSVNQFPYLEVRRPFILGTAEQKWKATLSHFFVQVLHDKGLLLRLYSQNIDGLDFQLSLPPEKIVNVHGSLGEIKCEFCGTEHPIEQFREEVRSKIKDIYGTDPLAPAVSSNILCSRCGRAGLKPATVMYGCDLPPKVLRSIAQDFPAAVELLIVAGTSLTVSPACQLVERVHPSVPRLLVNRELVGQHLGLQCALGSNYSDGSKAAKIGADSSSQVMSQEQLDQQQECSDVALLGDCDAGFLALAVELGWLEDLYQYKERMCEQSATLLEHIHKHYIQ